MMWKEKEEKEEEKEQYESCNTLTPSERGSAGGRPTAGGRWKENVAHRSAHLLRF